jgi:NAD(P)H-flavin reductase
LARELYTARLEKKVCISQVAQCYHFEFVLDGMESFPFASGQFISAVATDPNGKQQTRAYSIASAAKENRFDLCINRVENGFFSNYLCDLSCRRYHPGPRPARPLHPSGARHRLHPSGHRHRHRPHARLRAVAVS